MSRLVIDNVNLGDLEGQRVNLGSLSFNDEARRHMTPEEEDAVDAIVNMLDAWSDAWTGENHDSDTGE